MHCSIIIPLYNKEQYVEAAINSILAQYYQNFEIIVIDDGSSDNGASLVRAMPDPRIRLIQQANGGVSRARNRGIDESRGELIFFLDADDWYGRRYLETMVLMAKKHPIGTFFATSFKRVRSGQHADLESENESSHESELIKNFFERRRRSGAFFFTSSVAVRRTDLMALQPCFPIGDSYGEDLDLWFRLAERLLLAYCRSELVAYRVEVAGSLCATQQYNVLPPVFSRLEQRAQQLKMNKSSSKFALLLVVDARVSVARNALSNGRRVDAIVELSKAARGVVSTRWWLTVAMCLFFTPALVERWEAWRHQRCQ